VSSWNKKGSGLERRKGVLKATLMNEGGRAVVLGELMNEALRTTASGGKCCGVERQVVGARFICRGGESLW
jgi:hypothetical protein